jgi:hypothetical protein
VVRAGVGIVADVLDDFVQIETRRLRELSDLAKSVIADRVDQDPTTVEFDPATGALLNALSDAARAAKLAIAQKIVAKGGEDPGWGH